MGIPTFNEWVQNQGRGGHLPKGNDAFLNVDSNHIPTFNEYAKSNGINIQQPKPIQAPQPKQSFFGNIGHSIENGLSTLGHDIGGIAHAVTNPNNYQHLGKDVLNAFKTPLQVMTGNNDKTAMNKIKNAYNTRSNATKEVQRGLAKVDNSALLDLPKALGNKNLYNSQYDNKRQGVGGLADAGYNLLGLAVPFGAAYKGAEKLGLGVKEGAKGLSKVGQMARRGAVAGTMVGAGQGAVNVASGQENPMQALGNTAAYALMGGIGDPALHGLGQVLKKVPGIKNIFDKLSSGKITKQEATNQIKNHQEFLALPAPEQAKIDNVLALPEPKIQKYITAKPAPYSNKYDQLITKAHELQKQGKITPGREYQVLKDMWSQMAGPKDPSFDNLLKLANPSVKMNEIRNNPAGQLKAIKKAKETQNNAVYGDPNNLFNKPFKQQTLQELGNGGPLKFKKQVAPLQFKKSVPMDANGSPLLPKLEPRQPKQPKALNIDQTPKNKSINISQSKEPGLIDLQQEKLNNQLSNSDNWKNKGPISMGRETMVRNFQDVMGKDAPKMIKEYLDPIKSSEANRIRFLNKERNKVRDYGIKPKSKDDQLVQMYGEGKINLDELKQKTNNWEKVKKVAEEYRNKYDELLTKVNNVLESNGFDPIPKRKDYFPHYEAIDGLMHQFGFDMQDHSLPTDINGLTANFKPNKQFFSNALKRKSNETSYGAIEGFDRYIEGISNVIYHTRDIKKLRSLDKALRNKYEGDKHLNYFAKQLTEYTNLLAGKKSSVDRAIEDTVGRGVYNVLDTLKKRTGANMIGMNVGSAMTNFIPLTQAAASTDKRDFVKAMIDTMTNVIRQDGMNNKSDFLTSRLGSDPLYRNLWNKIIDKSMWLMKSLDKFTSQVIVRGKYYEGLRKGLSDKKAMKQANDYAASILADRSKGQIPTLFSSKTFGVLSQFQLEVNNQISHIFKDLPKNSKSKAALASSMAQLFIYSYAFNELYQKIMGRKPAFDPIGVAIQAYKDYNNPNLTNIDATMNTVKNIGNQLPFTSLGVGRFPISAGFPNIYNAVKYNTWGKELSKPLWYLILPTGGGQIKKTIEGLTSMNKNPLKKQSMTGNFNSKGHLQFPISNNTANLARGTLFGKYSFPETKAYYDNKRSPLTGNQTNFVEQSTNKKLAYNKVLQDQALRSYKSVINNKKLTRKQKEDKIKKIIEELNRLKGGK